MADHGGEVGGSERIFQEGPQKEGRNFIEEVTEPEKKIFFLKLHNPNAKKYGAK